MEISIKKDKDLNIMKVSGRMHSVNVQDFSRIIISMIEKEPMNILLDFSDLDYITSAGLAALLTAQKALRKKNYHISLCSLNMIVTNVFNMSGFTPLFTIFPSREEAVNVLLASR